MSELSNKTVNNVLTVLNTLLECAVEWGVIEEHPEGETLCCALTNSAQ